jgi:hypothetical protein
MKGDSMNHVFYTGNPLPPLPASPSSILNMLSQILAGEIVAGFFGTIGKSLFEIKEDEVRRMMRSVNQTRHK